MNKTNIIGPLPVAQPGKPMQPSAHSATSRIKWAVVPCGRQSLSLWERCHRRGRRGEARGDRNADTAISRLFVRAMESRCGRFAVSILALSGASRPCRVAAPSIRFARACVLLAAAPTATPCFRHWRRSSPLPPKGEPFGYTSTTFYHTFPLATRLNGQKTAKMGKKVEKMRSNHSAAAPQSHKTLGKKRQNLQKYHYSLDVV